MPKDEAAGTKTGSDFMMSMSPSAQSERRLSVIDQFCALTHQVSEMKARHVRGIISTLGFVCMVLLLLMGFFAWRANAVGLERDALVQELHAERAERIQATLAARDVEMTVASSVLDTRVRRDIVDQTMAQQEQRSVELEQLAEKIAQEKLIAAGCVTPKSILNASGL